MLAVSISDFGETLRKSDPQERIEPLRALTDLFLSAAPQLDDDSVEIVDTAFDFALRKPNAAALTDISVRMAPVPNAPLRLIKRLASYADISVAGPVLSQSPRLSETDLCEIAAAKGNSHLLAISARKHLTSPVTDILVVRGDDEVARSVVGNITAELSDYGVTRLLKRAESDETIGAGLFVRADVPPDVVGNGLANPESSTERARAKIAAAKQLAITLKQTGELTERKISALATEGRCEEMIASISLLSHLRYQLIERMTHGPRLQELALVCKSLDFKITTMNAICNLAASLNGATLAEIRNARGEFLAVSSEIAKSVQAAMSSLHPRPTQPHYHRCGGSMPVNQLDML